MIKQVQNVVIITCIFTLMLFFLGFAISYFCTQSLQTLDFILFILGAIPIVLFFSGVFSRSSSGSLHTPKVFYRLVSTVKRKKKYHLQVRVMINITFQHIVSCCLALFCGLLAILSNTLSGLIEEKDCH